MKDTMKSLEHDFRKIAILAKKWQDGNTLKKAKFMIDGDEDAVDALAKNLDSHMTYIGYITPIIHIQQQNQMWAAHQAGNAEIKAQNAEILRQLRLNGLH